EHRPRALPQCERDIEDPARAGRLHQRAHQVRPLEADHDSHPYHRYGKGRTAARLSRQGRPARRPASHARVVPQAAMSRHKPWKVLASTPVYRLDPWLAVERLKIVTSAGLGEYDDIRITIS